MGREEKLKEFVNNGEKPFMYERNIVCEYWDRVKAIVKGEETTPYEVELQPCATCNLHCHHCVGAAHKPSDATEINPEKMKLIIDHIAKMGGVERVKFSGYYGEPLINKEATLIGMRMAKKKHMKVGLFTNGTMIDDEVINTVMGIEYVNISLDAGSRESYLSLKGSDQFNRVVSNIRMLDGIRKQRGSNLEITVGYILNNENYREIPRAIEMLKNYVDMVRFKVNILNNDMSREELDEAYGFIDDAKRHESGRFRVISIHSRLEADRMQKPTFGRCYFLNLMGCIGCDGRPYPCDHKTYFGGDKNDIVPRRDCELCPPMGFRVNTFLEFMEKEHKKDPKFLEWVENFINREFK